MTIDLTRRRLSDERRTQKHSRDCTHSHTYARHSWPPRPSAPRLIERQCLAEERDHEFLKPHGDVAGVRARVDLEGVRNLIVVEDVVQLPGVDLEIIHIADVDGDRPVLAQIAD